MIHIEKDISLSELNALQLKSTCDYFVELNSVTDLEELIAKDFFDVERFFVLGGGSNLILPEHYSGLVIKPKFSGYEQSNDDNDSNIQYLKVGSGENWESCIDYCLDKGLIGLENLSLIPGTVGAAPIQNIGAYGREVCDFVESVEVFDFYEKKVKYLSNLDCEFAYRDSIFKRNPKQFLVISVTFRFSKTEKLKTDYASLTKLIEEKGFNTSDLSAKQLSNIIIELRQSRLPDPKLVPNAGSFFKNPIVSSKKLSDLLQNFPKLVYFPLKASPSKESPTIRQGEKEGVKLSAAWLIDQCSWKGKYWEGLASCKEEFDDGATTNDKAQKKNTLTSPLINSLAVSKNHALVIINEQGIKAGITQSHLLNFANQIQTDVKNKFNVCLEIEPVIKT